MVFGDGRETIKRLQPNYQYYAKIDVFNGKEYQCNKLIQTPNKTNKIITIKGLPIR